MVPGHGRLPAAKIKEHMIKRIESFGLNFKTDTINGTNDGCNTMISYGKMIRPKFMQLCLAHGGQLAILKVVCKKEKNPILNEEVTPANDEETEVEINADVDEDESDNESMTSEDEDEDETGLVNENPDDLLEFQGIY